MMDLRGLIAVARPCDMRLSRVPFFARGRLQFVLLLVFLPMVGFSRVGASYKFGIATLPNGGSARSPKRGL